MHSRYPRLVRGARVGAKCTVDTSAGSIPGFVRYRSIPEFCSILDTYVVIKSNFHIEHSSQ